MAETTKTKFAGLVNEIGALTTPKRGVKARSLLSSTMRYAVLNSSLKNGGSAGAFSIDETFSPKTLAHIKGEDNIRVEEPETKKSIDNASLAADVVKSMELAGIHSGGSVPKGEPSDLELAQKPCVVCSEDTVVFRSNRGPFIKVVNGAKLEAMKEIEITRDKDHLQGIATGNPTESTCKFVIVLPGNRRNGGLIKYGDKVNLLARSCGRFLGVASPNDPDFFFVKSTDDSEENSGQVSRRKSHQISFRKHTGQRDLWQIVSPMAPIVKDTSGKTNRKDSSSPLVSSGSILLMSVKASGYYLSCEDDGYLSLTQLDAYGSINLTSNMDKVWNIVKSPAPYQPAWSHKRPLLNGDYTCSEFKEFEDLKGKEKESMERGYPNDLEQATIDDLLFAMQGIPGNLIFYDDSFGKWSVAERLVKSPALKTVSERILPLCENFMKTEKFIVARSQPEYGRVSHALSAAIRKLVREYLVLLAQLENQQRKSQLSLQKLWYYIQPSMRTFEIISTLANKVCNYTGGALLNAIHKLATTGGDTKSRLVYRYLIDNATVPYLEMLKLWIYEGVIRDPYDEFMVCVDPEASNFTMRDDFNARYWEERFTLRVNSGNHFTSKLTVGRHQAMPQQGSEETHSSNSRPSSESNSDFGHVPYFLTHLSALILTTGKYLNVIRECGRWVRNVECDNIQYSDESHAYDTSIRRAHDFASRTLLELLLTEEKLLDRLRSIKHYFLLDQGDFFVHFMDLAGEELGMPAKDISITRLQSLLEMCLRARNINDPYQEDLECGLSQFSLIEHVSNIHYIATHLKSSQTSSNTFSIFPVPKENLLEGVNAFTLDFRVRWPLSLVLSKQALTKYQLIFRHLFFCKHVETRVCTGWLQQQHTKELNSRKHLGPQYALLQRMLHFLQNFEYYVMFEVLEPRWHEFEQRFNTVKTVDELMKHHSEFLDTCLRECLLTHQGLLKTLATLMSICLNFVKMQQDFARNLDAALLTMHSQNAKGLGHRLLGSDDVDDRLRNMKPSHQALRLDRQRKINFQEDTVRNLIGKPAYRGAFEKAQKDFDKTLNDFMDELINEATHGEYHSHLKNLCTRLDFNSFYKK